MMWIDPTSLPPAPDAATAARRSFAVNVVERLREAGHHALWAGGCVRDLLLGHEPADYDVATDAPPERVTELFRRTVPVGISFGVVRVLGPTRESGQVEVATFRTDGRYLDGRRPETVSYGTAAEDASRRDFTINGMFLDPVLGQVLDYVGGREDLKARLIRAIGDPDARFDEDKLRLLRAVRFAARFGFRIEEDTEAALRRRSGEVTVVAPERIAQELRRLLSHSSRARGVDLALDTGLLAAVLPELSVLASRPHEPDQDAWWHVERVLVCLGDAPSFPLALAALLHEAGTPEEDVRLAHEIGHRLRLSNAERDRAAWLVAHQREIREPRRLPPSRLKTLLAHPGADELIALVRAHEIAACHGQGAADFCESYRRDLPDGPLDPPALLTGADLKDAGLEPGPVFKDLLDRARTLQLDGALADRDAALAWLARAKGDLA
jgi:poly(A) polymerase